MISRILAISLVAIASLEPEFGVSPQVAHGQQRGSGSPYASPTPLPAPAIFGEGTISTGDDESHPAFTPDGRELYFLKNTPTFNHWTIVVSRYEDGKWATPQVAPFSGQYSDADPFITHDGKRLYFISTRPVDDKPKQDTDIWIVERSGAGWGDPVHLGPSVNSEANEWFPTLSDSGTLYFGSERAGGKGRSDIWRAKTVGDRYGDAENLGERINTAAGEFEALVAADESFLIVAAAGRQDGRGAFDLYVSRKDNGAWTPLENLGDTINSAGWDFSPKLSPDGKYLFFTSSRGFADAPLGKKLSYEELLARLHAPGNGLRDIYRVDAGSLGLTGIPGR